MKISTRAALLVAGVLAATGLQVVPASAGVPACGDFITGALTYTTDKSPSSASFGKGVVTVNSDFAAPTCADWDYTVIVLNDSGTTTLAQQTRPGDGNQTLAHTLVVPSDPFLAPNTVCVYGESSRKRRVGDRAPDSGCVKLTLDSDPGGQNWS